MQQLACWCGAGHRMTFTVLYALQARHALPFGRGAGRRTTFTVLYALQARHALPFGRGHEQVTQ
jgi:hypothetical protein